MYDYNPIHTFYDKVHINICHKTNITMMLIDDIEKLII